MDSSTVILSIMLLSLRKEYGSEAHMFTEDLFFPEIFFFVLLHSVIKYCNSMWHCRNLFDQIGFEKKR